MSALRNRLCRWPGIPTRAEIRAMILREIDADRAAAIAAERGRASFIDIIELGREIADDREARIVRREREDTRV